MSVYCGWRSPSQSARSSCRTNRSGCWSGSPEFRERHIETRHTGDLVAVDTFFVGHRKDLEDELNRRAWRDTLPRFALRPRALDSARYEAFAAFLLDQGVIETNPPLETYAVEIR